MDSPHDVHFGQNPRMVPLAVKRNFVLIHFTEHPAVMRAGSFDELDQAVELLSVLLTAFELLRFHAHRFRLCRDSPGDVYPIYFI